MFLKIKNEKGFTLIELLVVVAIVGLLSSVVLASLNSARAKGRDANKKIELKEIYTTLQRFWIDNGTSPTNPAAGTSWCAISSGTCAQELKNPNYFVNLPISPVPADPFYYYDYGAFFTVAVHLEQEAYGPGSQAWHCSDAAGGVIGSKFFCYEFFK